MAIYDFECPKCKYKEEKIVSMLERNNKKFLCDKCGTRMNRLLGNVSKFNFKGSGFYQTDFKDK